MCLGWGVWVWEGEAEWATAQQRHLSQSLEVSAGAAAVSVLEVSLGTERLHTHAVTLHAAHAWLHPRRPESLRLLGTGRRQQYARDALFVRRARRSSLTHRLARRGGVCLSSSSLPCPLPIPP